MDSMRKGDRIYTEVRKLLEILPKQVVVCKVSHKGMEAGKKYLIETRGLGCGEYSGKAYSYEDGKNSYLVSSDLYFDCASGLGENFCTMEEYFMPPVLKPIKYENRVLVDGVYLIVDDKGEKHLLRHNGVWEKENIVEYYYLPKISD